MPFDFPPIVWTLTEWVQANLHWILLLFVVHFVTLGTVAYLILLERKVASWVQDRIGPNRVGPFGLLQPIADGIKFLVKEDYRPARVDTVLYTLAPAVMVIVVIVSVAVIPWGGIKGMRGVADVTAAVREVPVSAAGTIDTTAVSAAITRGLPRAHRIVGDVQLYVGPASDDRPLTAAADDPRSGIVPTTVLNDRGYVLPGQPAVPPVAPGQAVYARYTSGFFFQIANLNIGVLFVLSVLSLAVYGVVVGGWASNNKYSFLGGLRATANMISYEIPLGISVLCVVVMYGTLDLNSIVERQAGWWLGFLPAWNVFTQPVTFLLFLICIHAEANRAPFDMAEAEQELVGGYHTEYSSMRFALFFLAEYLGMITTSLVCVALFFGGWHLPWLGGTLDAARPAVTDSWAVVVLRCLVFFAKAILVLFVFMWVRWSLPRFRFDQLMQLAWRALIPLSVALLAGTILVVYFTGGRSLRRVDFVTALAFFGMNVVVTAVALFIAYVGPKGPAVNRRVALPNSRYRRDLPAGPGSNGDVPAAGLRPA